MLICTLSSHVVFGFFFFSHFTLAEKQIFMIAQRKQKTSSTLVLSFCMAVSSITQSFVVPAPAVYTDILVTVFPARNLFFFDKFICRNGIRACMVPWQQGKYTKTFQFR